MLLHRRSLIFGAVASLLAAPPIVRVTSLMQIRGEPLWQPPIMVGWSPKFRYWYDKDARTIRFEPISDAEFFKS